MKKTASILLMLLLLTSLLGNIVNYYVIVQYEKEQSWVQSMQNSEDSSFKVIKLNATLYSFMEDTDIEKVNENIILDNKIYHVFKKKIKDNVLNLYYLGVENQSVIDISLKKLIDSQDDSESSNSAIEKLLKSFFKDYLFETTNKLNNCCKTFFCSRTLFISYTSKVLLGFSTLKYNPPKMV